MRERRSLSWHPSRCPGITPARAGKTCKSGLVLSSTEDHPRSCGKDFVCVFRRTSNVGSPPLVRERRCLSFFRTRELRITPARAGKTVVRWQKALIVWDHPRSCGKDNGQRDWQIALTGSPPLVRERHAVRKTIHDKQRITPARAGKTQVPNTVLTRVQGSPPLVRERLDNISVMTSSTGITPARAGKTAMAGLPVQAAGDHPRSCGKDPDKHVNEIAIQGSPPLVRERRCSHHEAL